mmetsp:Transcript_43288/g.119706  ORF Transcript_43288/g.119706 Transcript_43288/m.119706 type:complete len:571 (-) Transcript_43288:67-1779(-)
MDSTTSPCKTTLSNAQLVGQARNAAAVGDGKTLRSLVKQGLDVNSGDLDKRTAVHLAASEGELSIVELLVRKYSADLTVKDRWGGTPLDDAIRSGHKDVAALLQRKGGSVGKTSSLADDAVLMCSAGYRGDTERLTRLVGSRVDVNICDSDKRTALHLAASQGKLACVKSLIEKCGADQNVKDRLGGTPVDDAIRGRHAEVHAYLEQMGAQRGKTASMNTGDATDLCAAASSGDLVVLRKLVQEGQDVNAGDYDQRTAIHLAASEGLLPVIKCLVEELGADPNVVDRWGSTPLDDAFRTEHVVLAELLTSKHAKRGKTAISPTDGEVLAKAGATGDVSCVLGLMKQRSDINSSNFDKRTALHFGAANGHLQLVTALIENCNADVHVVDSWGNTPLDDAIRGGHVDVSDYLKGKGFARSEAAAWGMLDAAARGDVSSLRSLHEQGAGVDVKDYDDRTPLHLAASRGHLAAVQCLLEEMNVSLNISDCQGSTALDASARSGHHDVGTYLKSKGALGISKAAKTVADDDIGVKTLHCCAPVCTSGLGGACFEPSLDGHFPTVPVYDMGHRETR